MKRFLKYISFTTIIAVTIIIAIFLGIVAMPKNVFYASYQSVIQDKFNQLKNTNEPKIIIVGGSNAAFGIDQYMLEEATGYKVANLGLHAGFGPVFYTELSKANINKGDIVLLAYEYGWREQGTFEKIGTELVMTGIDSELSIYQEIPPRFWKSILGYLFTYGSKKAAYQGAQGVYSREAFDSNGQMIYPRETSFEAYSGNESYYGYVDLNNTSIAEDVIAYLTEYKTLIEEKGAKVFFISPPVFEEAVRGEKENVYIMVENEEKQIGIPYISDPADYFFPKELMYDTIYHCNDKGESERTKLLIEDLRDAEIPFLTNG